MKQCLDLSLSLSKVRVKQECESQHRFWHERAFGRSLLRLHIERDVLELKQRVRSSLS